MSFVWHSLQPRVMQAEDETVVLDASTVKQSFDSAVAKAGAMEEVCE